MTVVFTFFILLSPALASPRLHSTSPPAPMPPLVFEDGNGAQHALSDYRGQFVLLNLWATWCAPCAREMPSLDALQKNFDLRRLTVLPLSEDRGDATVGAFYRSRGLSHLPIALDTAGRALSALHLHGLPTSILINPQGDEVARAEGEADWTSPEEMGVLQAQMGN
ncbi:MAG: TlpA disulfide reductase family protein [Alphaproteobacteria bacterium]|nr:TlpA disulfide reductase family protein [Alphaproteobacteria bacterium]